MQQTNPSGDHQKMVIGALEVTIKVGIVIGLIAWCFIILKPFIMLSLWGIIIAVAMYPLFHWLAGVMRGRRKLAATLVTLFLLLIIFSPIVMLAGSLVEAVQWFRVTLEGNQSIIPPPTEQVQEWPLIGKQLYRIWAQASENLSGVAVEYKDQLITALRWFLSTATGAGVGLITFIVSILISGVLLVFSDEGSKAAEDFGGRLLGSLGEKTVRNMEVTVRNVARGILGVAFIQAVLAGLGFLVAGVPGAGLWALIAFIFCIVQVGPVPVIIPVLIWVFLKSDTVTFIALLVWCIPITLIDNILKPLLLGKGAPAPMVVVFLGAIGGFISFGIIGLFVGAVVLSLGYNLFRLWMKNGVVSPPLS
jgi:predicted PurR-regulated permease PerM